MLDFFRFTNGNEQIWTYKVKEKNDQTLKSRIDYVLGTPSLANAISDVKHIFHEYELTDHATSFFSIDFIPTSKGPGVFRAHPALLKNKDYCCIIENSIRFTLIEDLKNKDSAFYKENLAKLHKKIQIQEEIGWLKEMEQGNGWSVNDRILTLSAELLNVEDGEVSTEAILDQVHETDHDLLLEIVLANMRQETLTFQKHLQKGKRDKRRELITKINELNSYINEDGYYKEAKEKEGELRKLNEEFLADQAAIFKNTALLNDCKPTKEFLNMEQLKGSYCSITKLRVEKTDVTTGEKVEKEIIEPHEIRDEMKNFYQDIFDKQTVKDGDQGIEDFLKSDGDTDPYEGTCQKTTDK